jgi:hypothetical protein
MQGDIEKAKERERMLRERPNTRQSTIHSKILHIPRLQKSLNGNYYIKMDGHVIVFMEDKYKKGQWRYSIDGEFSKYAYSTLNDALEAAIKNIK